MLGYWSNNSVNGYIAEHFAFNMHISDMNRNNMF